MTPTPPMTPEQRAELVSHAFYPGAVYAANQLEADGLALAAAQAEIERLTSPDTITLPRAEVEALMIEMEWAKGVLHHRLTHPNDEGYLSGFDAALAALQERMK